MSSGSPAPVSEAECPPAYRQRRRDYIAAFSEFAESLPAPVRKRINGSASPDWSSTGSFAKPVNPDHPAYRTEEADPIVETLNELADLRGALPKILLWITDRIPEAAGLGAVASNDKFRIAIARICDAKNARLEAHLVSLALGMNLHGNANGYAIAAHFSLRPQTIHEMLADTCAALDLPKPLAKANKARYAATQYRHNIRSSA